MTTCQQRPQFWNPKGSVCTQVWFYLNWEIYFVFKLLVFWSFKRLNFTLFLNKTCFINSNFSNSKLSTSPFDFHSTVRVACVMTVAKFMKIRRAIRPNSPSSLRVQQCERKFQNVFFWKRILNLNKLAAFMLNANTSYLQYVGEFTLFSLFHTMMIDIWR